MDDGCILTLCLAFTPSPPWNGGPGRGGARLSQTPDPKTARRGREVDANFANWREWGNLDDERYKRLHFPAVSRIFIGEMPQHQLFFLLELDPKARSPQHQSEPAAQPARVHRRPDAHQQQAGVDGMPHETVRPRLHQL